MKRVLEYAKALPAGVRGRLASEAEIVRTETVLGPLRADHRWFLMNVGRCPVGSEWMDGIDEIVPSNLKFQEEVAAWSMRNVVIAAWDGCGDPIGLERTTGRVLVEHHDGPAGVHELGPSFESYLLDLIRRSGA